MNSYHVLLTTVYYCFQFLFLFLKLLWIELHQMRIPVDNCSMFVTG